MNQSIMRMIPVCVNYPLFLKVVCVYQKALPRGGKGKQAGETNIHVQVYGIMVPQDVQELIFRIRDHSIFTWCIIFPWSNIHIWCLCKIVHFEDFRGFISLKPVLLCVVSGNPCPSLTLECGTSHSSSSVVPLSVIGDYGCSQGFLFFGYLWPNLPY